MGAALAGRGDLGGDVEVLSARDAGEVLTLQRAAYVGEAMLYDQFLPPLFETLDEVADVLASDVTVLGLRDGPRLIGTVRIKPDGEIARLAVAPDRQHEGLGTRLLAAAIEHGGTGCSPATAARPTCGSTAGTASRRPTASPSPGTPDLPQAAGSVTRTASPPSTRGVSASRPPCASATERTIESPRPAPPRPVRPPRSNGSTSRAATAGSMTGPEFTTSSTAPRRPTRRAHGHEPARRVVADAVLDQVARQALQQPALAADAHGLELEPHAHAARRPHRRAAAPAAAARST